jgi:SNF2 family DNA or RNA helicase
MTDLWRHQQAALGFWRERRSAGRRGTLLAMDMGTGKSRLAVEIAHELEAKLALVVSPLRVVDVWRRQFAQFSREPYTVLALDDSAGSVAQKAARAQQMVTWSRAQTQRLVIAVNYESARIEPLASWIVQQAWPLVILDESHRISNPSGRTSRWAARLGLRAHYRLALTGTPLPHSPLNIWAQFRYLDPRLLEPTFGEFRARYAVMGGYYDREIVGWRNLDELEQRMAAVTFRVDNSVLDLPPELDQVLSCYMSSEGARIYQEMEEKMIALLDTDPATAANPLVRLLRLQQITGGTLPDDQGLEHHVDSAKEELLEDFFSDLPPEEPVVVFAVFSSDLRAIHRAAHKQKRRSAELSGARDELAVWQKGGEGAPTILGVQIRAGGVGVDLTRAHIAVYYSLGFSLADYLQSRARIRRPPQQRPCVYYHLQVRHSIDEYVLVAVERREELVDRVLHELKQKGAESCHRLPLLN